MKKGLLFALLILSVFGLSACKKPEDYAFNFYEYMDTFISINLYTDSSEHAQVLEKGVQDIYRTYHELTNNYEPLSSNSGFKENLFSINGRINEDIEIDQELYEILKKADDIHTLTNGYFDISIGKMVDVWKDVILNEDAGYLHNNIPETVFNQIIKDLEDIEVIEEPFILSESEGKFYVRLTHEDVKLDLGALSKGYATQLVYDYLIAEGVEYFSITAGSSSISVGKNYNRNTNMYHVSLANPIKTTGVYGMMYVQNRAINTSGNFEQYALYQGLRYHHVISPKTKMPAQYYHTVTVLGNDAGILDALSTALFSMPSNEFELFITTLQDEYELEVIRFNYDETVTTFLKDTVFEEYDR